MLGLILDVLILMVLIKMVTGDDDGGMGKPALVAVLAAFGMTAATLAANRSPDNGLMILLGALLGVGLIVTLCCIGLMKIPFGKSAIIGGGFLAFKFVFILLTAIVFA